jgi:hypothetical protein
MKMVGTGITKRIKADRVPANAASMRAFFQRHNKRIVEPWGGMAYVVKQAQTRLDVITSRLPDPTEDPRAYNAAFVERDTEAWYLKSIGIEARIADAAISEGRPWEAVACAMRIGELVTELRFKKLWEEPALYGVRTAEERASGAQSVRKMSAAERVAAVEAALASGKLSLNAAYRAAAAKYASGGTWKAFERDWRKHKNRPQPSE